MRKPNNVEKYTIIALCLILIGVGAWGVSAYWDTADIGRTIGGFEYPKMSFFSSKMYFSLGAFTAILMSAVFVLYSVLVKTGEIHQSK